MINQKDISKFNSEYKNETLDRQFDFVSAAMMRGVNLQVVERVAELDERVEQMTEWMSAAADKQANAVLLRLKCSLELQRQNLRSYLSLRGKFDLHADEQMSLRQIPDAIDRFSMEGYMLRSASIQKTTTKEKSNE